MKCPPMMADSNARATAVIHHMAAAIRNSRPNQRQRGHTLQERRGVLEHLDEPIPRLLAPPWNTGRAQGMFSGLVVAAVSPPP